MAPRGRGGRLLRLREQIATGAATMPMFLRLRCDDLKADVQSACSAFPNLPLVHLRLVAGMSALVTGKLSAHHQ